MFRFSNIHFRILLSFFIVASILFMIRDYLVYEQTRDSLITSREDQLNEVVTYSIKSSEPVGELRANNLEEVANKLERPSLDFAFLVFDKDGSPIRGSNGAAGPAKKRDDIPYTEIAIGNQGSFSKIFPPGDGIQFHTLVLVLPVHSSVGSPLGVIQAEVLLDEADHQLSVLKRRLAIGFAGGLAFGLLFALWTLRLSLRPLEKLTRTANAISEGDITKRMEITDSRDEVQGLAMSFNKMVDQLETALSEERLARDQMENFLSDAAHELRTPLTVIRGYADVLNHTPEGPIRQRILDSMRNEINRLTRLVNDLLNLTRVKSNVGINIKELDMNDLCHSTLAQIQLLAKDRRVSCESTEQIFVNGDEDKLREVLLNLLDNAVKNTEANGEIVLSASRSDKDCLIQVSNKGAPISPDFLPHIFERFKTLKISAGSEKGTGLGLAIAKAIVEAHKGTITVRSTVDEGTIFTVSIPASR